MKRIKYLLQLIDGLWSVPLGFFIFFGSGLFLSSVFGMAVGQYDRHGFAFGACTIGELP